MIPLLTSKQSDVQGSTPFVVALVQIGAVGIRMGGARVKVGIGRPSRGLGEQGAEELGVSRVGGVMEGTVMDRIGKGKREREKEGA